jgi:hypothetical protein
MLSASFVLPFIAATKTVSHPQNQSAPVVAMKVENFG